METNTTVTNWMNEELNTITTQTENNQTYLPSMKFEENKIVEFTVDFTNKFTKWQGTGGRNGGTVTKAIIPVMHNNEKKVLWLNVKNPLYHELVKRGSSGQKVFKVIQTGKQKETKYNIVE